MASDTSPSFGGTLTAGIQDISALLPLLGTEQCEDHVSSALTKGYLYASATPMSIFGSLGMARAGFKTLLASINIPRFGFIGAERLSHSGFKPSGDNVSLIMFDPNNDEHTLLETRVDSMLKDLHIDDASRVTASTKCTRWNMWMIFATGLFCALSITPYIHLIRSANTLKPFLLWGFPMIRGIGGFLVAITIQILVQNRILVTVKKQLLLKSLDDDRFAELRLDRNKALGLGGGSRRPGLDVQLWNLEESIESRLADLSEFRRRVYTGRDLITNSADDVGGTSTTAVIEQGTPAERAREDDSR